MSALALAAFGFAACSDDDEPVPGTQPTVTFATTPPATTASSVTVEATATDADRAAWMIQDRTTEAPTVQTVLADGTSFAVGKAQTITASDLEAGKEYTIYAAAAKGDVVGKIASLEVKTAAQEYTDLLTLGDIGKNFVSYHIEVEEGTTYRHLVILKNTYDSYVVNATTDEQRAQMIGLMLSIYGSVGTGPADYVLRDLDPNPNSFKPYDVLAGMDYVAMACPTDAEGKTFTGTLEAKPLKTLDPELLTQRIGVEIERIGDSDADIRCTPDEGLRYFFEQIIAKAQAEEILAASGEKGLLERIFVSVSQTVEFGNLSEWTGLQEKTDYIHYTIGVDAEGNRTALIATPFTTIASPKVDLENLTFDRVVTATYYGEVEENLHDFYVLLADQPMQPNEYGVYEPDAFPCHAINCEFYSASGAGQKLPEGVYEISDSFTAGTLDFDYTWAPYFGRDLDDYREFYFVTGTITVTHEGTGYRFVVDMDLEDGSKFTGTYAGDIDFESDGPSPFGMSARPAKKVTATLRR